MRLYPRCNSRKAKKRKNRNCKTKNKEYMSVLSELTKDEAFAITLYDISQGESVETMRMVLKDYEEREEFEVCAGIHLGIEIASFITLKTVVENHFENNLELTFDEL